MSYVTKQNLIDLMPMLAAKVQGLTEWKANTSYSVGQYILNDGTIYKVTTNFTSTTTFDDTNLEVVSPKGLTAQDVQDVIDAVQ